MLNIIALVVVIQAKVTAAGELNYPRGDTLDVVYVFLRLARS